ncbi:MAG TPA: hypothetical protein VG937_14985 [Polyangiaceae bacterium]|nr:hypothetical protein [Polyangiaceae bacterium]
MRHHLRRTCSAALATVALGSSAVFGSGCSGARAPEAETVQVSSEPVEFAFGVLDGTVLTAENTRGRATVLLFATSYDLPSQVAARRLDEVLHQHQPRFNAACVVLEAADNAILVQTFRDTLHLSYPVAIADVVEIRSSTAFSKIDRVPTVVVLDRRGRERLRHYGGFEAKDLAAWLASVER